MDQQNGEKVIFRAESGDFEITESAKGEKPPRRPEKQRKEKQPPRRKKKRGLLITILTAVIVIGLCAALFSGYVYSSYQYYTAADEAIRSAAPHEYTAATVEEMLNYLTHPALQEGDTIHVNGHFMIDVDQEIGGFLSMGLVNFDCASGSLTLSGGTVIMASGREESVIMDGVSFIGTNLFIEAGKVDLSWAEASDPGNINVKTLNGAANQNQLVIPAPGGKMVIPVTVTNVSGAAQDNIEVRLISPSFLFIGGDTVTMSLAAGAAEIIDVPVIVTEGGRAKISAIGTDASGLKVLEGKSDFIELLGGGFYSGDPHTHTNASYTERYDSNLADNVFFAAEKGHSFIFSVENDDYGAELPQGEVDAIVGEAGVFLQISSLETGMRNQLKHILVYNYEGDIPSSNYGVNEWTGQNRLMQDAIYEIWEADPEAIIYIPHPFGYGVDLTGSMNNLMSLQSYAGIEILDQTSFSDWTEFAMTINIWNNLNIRNRLRVFAIGASNNLYSEYVGSRYTKGYMPSLTEENIYTMLRGGNMFVSNGPEIRFTLGGAEMGKDLYANPGEPVTVKIYAHSENPLTAVRLIRYDIDGSWENLEPDYVLEESFDGTTYSYEIETTVMPAVAVGRDGSEQVIDQYYRVEVESESPYWYNNVDGTEKGMAFSNPIWVSAPEAGSNDVSFSEIRYAESPPSGTVFGLDLGVDLSFLDGLAQQAVEKFYGVRINEAEMRTGGNGTRYIAGDGSFAISGFSASARDNQLVTVNYHRYDSASLADKVTVMVMAEDRITTGVETVYLLDQKQ